LVQGFLTAMERLDDVVKVRLAQGAGLLSCVLWWCGVFE